MIDISGPFPSLKLLLNKPVNKSFYFLYLPCYFQLRKILNQLLVKWFEVRVVNDRKMVSYQVPPVEKLKREECSLR
jgi:hypothetical protein